MVALSLNAPQQVKAGEQFKVALRLKADGGLSSLPFQLSFDAGAFQVIEVAEGPYFKQNGAETNISTNVDQSGGKIFGTVIRNAHVGAQGDDHFAVITMKALPGKTQGAVAVLLATPLSGAGRALSAQIPGPVSIPIVN